MNTINEITATYQRIAEEGRSELNKVQNKIYRIGSLRLLLFVAGIAGIIYFWSSGWIVLTGIIAVTLLPFILLIKYHNRLFHRKDYLEKKIAINEHARRGNRSPSATTAARCWTCGKWKYPKRPPKTPPAFLCVIPLPMERFTNMTRTRSK